jgi:aarF domain-containing kinase
MNLLDLGAGRDFDDNFLDNYMQIIWGAYKDDKDKIWHHSEQVGFLTGEESKEMYNAQYAGTMIVGEPFRTTKGELYDFG